ncbi:MAG: triose-phosphate isomerase [Zoogloeaceae bacterium]|jgi:triosephosphate isomerase|nr:triose-phosphate isomerase [Zoogloeaceae bacterium]
MSPVRPAFVAGNWKMNGALATNAALLEKLRAGLSVCKTMEVAVFPPFPYLDQAARLLSGATLALGAQDVSIHAAGAYTGEVAATMLVEFGCRHALVGHSERRSLHQETDALVAQKFGAAQAAGLIPVLCLGETLAERQVGETLTVVMRQLEAVLARYGVHSLANAVLAYEPVWAIGAGRTATPEAAQAVHLALRQQVALRDAAIAEKLRIVYGGSVKADNAAQLFAAPDIDGALVGGAALNADEFLAICRAVNP